MLSSRHVHFSDMEISSDSNGDAMEEYEDMVPSPEVARGGAPAKTLTSIEPAPTRPPNHAPHIPASPQRKPKRPRLDPDTKASKVKKEPEESWFTNHSPSPRRRPSFRCESLPNAVRNTKSSGQMFQVRGCGLERAWWTRTTRMCMRMW
jgi:hypothetical protein